MLTQDERRAEIYDLAKKVLGTPEDADAWMRKPAIGLNRQIPAVLIETAVGADMVGTYLLQIEHGVYV